jgi:beta-glucosidase
MFSRVCLRRAGLLALAVLLSGLSASVAYAENSAIVPVPREDNGWMARHQSMNDRVKQGNVDLLFIGDSITHGWEGAGKEVWNEYYPNRNAVNLGIGGDQTQHVLWRLDNGNIDNITPKLAVIMIGTNNCRGNSAAEIAEGVEAIVKKLRTKLPEMRILLLAIFPRTDVDAETQQKIKDATAQFAAAVAADPMVEFMDIGPAFLNEKGELPKDVMPDLLHPNAKGYEIEAKVLEPVISRLLAAAGGWTPLFNGKDLSGWEAVGGKSSWQAKDGILFTEGAGGAWLSTTKEYGDFDLSLEFKIPKGGNSGVFIRAPRSGNPAFEGSEIQVLDDADEQYKDLKPYQFTGSVYSTIAATPRVTKPFGQWQKMEIHIQGQKITVTVNGTKVVDGDLSEHMDLVKDHPGLKRTSGFIGLQDHSSRLDYRNILIREIK